jgi:hypothetical protein
MSRNSDLQELEWKNKKGKFASQLLHFLRDSRVKGTLHLFNCFFVFTCGKIIIPLE